FIRAYLLSRRAEASAVKNEPFGSAATVANLPLSTCHRNPTAVALAQSEGGNMLREKRVEEVACEEKRWR
ncbi:MAG TPA: hypothetical protein VIC04_07140, partial [Terriglobia bacterium]